MVMAPETVRDLEGMLRNSGVLLTPMERPKVDEAAVLTADGLFRISPARVENRQETMVTLYRTDTAEAIPTDVNEALKRLKKKYPIRGDFAATYPQLAGRYAFTLGKQDPHTGAYGPPTPILPTPQGGELCWLNPKSELFTYTRQLGVVSVCRSIAHWGDLNLEEHIKAKHAGVWPRIERARNENQENQSQGRITQLIELVLAQRGIDARTVPVAEVAREVQEQERQPVPEDSLSAKLPSFKPYKARGSHRKKTT